MKSVKSEVKVLAFTRSGRSKQLQEVVNRTARATATVVDGPIGDTGSGNVSYGIIDMLMAIFSIFTYVIDIVLEVRLAVFYYGSAVAPPISDEHYLSNKTMCQLLQTPDQSSYMIWFYVTLAFIIFPSTIGGLCSLSWHITDFRMRRKASRNTPIFRYAARFILPLLMLGPVLHNIEAIIYAIAARRSNRKHRQLYLYEQALFEDADAALLRIVECFLESLPQLVLQLHIVIASTNLGVRPVTVSGDIRALPICSTQSTAETISLESNTDPVCDVAASRFAEWFPTLPREVDCQLILQIVSMAATLIGAAWALVSYQRTLRRFLFSHRQLPLFPSSFVLFLAHLCLLSGRVLAIVLFVQALGWGSLCGLLLIHTLVMFTWLQCGCTTSSKKRAQLPSGFCCSDSLFSRCWFNIVLSLMYTSTYINIFDTPSNSRYLFFFSISTVENTAFILSWFFLTTSLPSATAHFTAISFLALSLSLLFGGILLLIMYYKFFHPNVFHNSSSCCKSRKMPNNNFALPLTTVD